MNGTNRSLAESLYAVTPGASEKARAVYRRVLAQDAGLDATQPKVYERWFRDAIAANPELVIDPCRAAGLTDEAWYLWKVEHSVTDVNENSIGSIDVLLISSSGRIGIVETKLAYSPGKRRAVLAQLLDYAVHLQELDDDEMPALPPAAHVSRDDMLTHLTRGDFLLIIAGDEVDPRVVKLSQAIIGDHMLNQWQLALVDLTVYQATDEKNPTRLMVPNLRGTSRTETRNVVRVDVPKDGGRPRVTLERLPVPLSGQQASVEAFLNAIEGKEAAGSRTSVGTLLEELKGAGCEITPLPTGVKVTFQDPRTDEREIRFVRTTNEGRARIGHVFGNQLAACGCPRNIAERYVRAIAQWAGSDVDVLGKGKGAEFPLRVLSEAHRADFMTLVKGTLGEIRGQAATAS